MTRMVTRTRGPATSRIVKAATLHDKQHINIGVYGDSGVGKTVFAGSHPKSLILAADTGAISAARMNSKADVWPCPDWEEFEEAQKWVRAGGYSRYDWIIPDGLTMLRERNMRWVLDKEHKRNPGRDLFIPAQPDHQATQNMMKYTVQVFCDLPVNVLFTALPMPIETKEGEDRVLMAVHGQKGDTAHYIQGLLDAVGYMHVTRKRLKGDDEDEPTGRVVRRIQWTPWGPYTAKDRFGVLAPYTDDATLPEIERMIKESGSPESRASARPVRNARTAARRTARTTRRSA